MKPLCLSSEPVAGSSANGKPSSFIARISAALLGSLPRKKTWVSVDMTRLFPQPDLAEEADPALYLGGVVRGKSVRIEPGRLKADGAELVLHVGLLDDIDDGLAERRPDVLWYPRRPVDPEPSGQLDARDAGLLEGRQTRNRRLPVRTAHGQSLDQAGPDLLHDHREDLDQQVDRSAHEIVERRRAAAIGHMQQAGAGRLHEQLDREIVQGADAG